MMDADTPRKKVNSHDVAERAGVSRSAVSRTFTDGASVSEETRSKVMKAAMELGYRVNALARSLHTQRSDLVGLVAADMDNPFRAEQIDCLSKLLRERGFKPILLRGEATANVSEMIGALLQYSVAGVIVTSDTPPEQICVECQRHGVPLVTINKQDPGAPVDRVQCDFEHGGRMAFDHLHSIGCRKLALVLPQKPSHTIAGRAGTFEDRCREQEIPLQRIACGLQDYESGLAAANLVAAKSNEIDGIFCVADYMALGLLDGLRHEHGIKVPGDMRLIGFDDIPQAGWKAYSLTTIRQSREELARNAIDLLIQRIETPELPPQEHICSLDLCLRST
ncbi:LacI family DNA-binding transcriptional regulator [uncultured Roseibium sp.]|uniref:LacI family DNA-binding transcriptional regulator n=1 Tax=uncultured Roseibium sp. TaxID=1936171 RepID=UPI002595478C|nr:LacI family DNA-binding transcriptional regulator [uncultured Roseibium sp.]